MCVRYGHTDRQRKDRHISKEKDRQTGLKKEAEKIKHVRTRGGSERQTNIFKNMDKNIISL